jgi:hypothetical protein
VQVVLLGLEMLLGSTGVSTLSLSGTGITTVTTTGGGGGGGLNLAEVMVVQVVVRDNNFRWRYWVEQE